MIYRPSEARAANANNLQATDTYYSSKKDESFKVDSDKLRSMVLDFKKKGGKITKFTQEDVDNYKIMPLKFKHRRKGWGGASHTDKSNGIKGEVEDEMD